jgi:molecular chaperone DnaJ
MDLYLVLGLQRTATLGDIKRAYRRLARKYHPDINPGDRTAEARFRQITEAYETLSDPARRQKYDVLGRVGEAADPTFGFEGFDFSVSVHAEAAPTFGDLFADVLHRDTRRVPEEPARGDDLHAHLSLSFEESMRGVDRDLTITRRESCAGCGGTGTVRTADVRCPHCVGVGSVRSTRGHMVFSKACDQCGGTGRQRPAPCPACGGQGAYARTETVAIRIPPGVVDGARVRAAGKGNSGRRGGSPGDLYITAHVEPHPLFRREGDDLHLVVPISVAEAALGDKIEVPTIDGPARLRIPPGTQSGQRFRLRERGAPSTRDGRRGDLVIEVKLVLPRLVDERSKELLREFGKINRENVRSDLLRDQKR